MSFLAQAVAILHIKALTAPLHWSSSTDTPYILEGGKKGACHILGAISLSCHNAFYHLCRPLFQSCHCLNLKNHPQSQARSVSAECRNLTEQICARGSWSQKSSYSAIRKSKLSKQAVPPASSDPAFVSL